MSESRVIIDVDIDELMDYVSMSDAVGFVYDCYEHLGASQQQDFIEKLGVEKVIEFFNDEEIVEHLGDNTETLITLLCSLEELIKKTISYVEARMSISTRMNMCADA